MQQLRLFFAMALLYMFRATIRPPNRHNDTTKGGEQNTYATSIRTAIHTEIPSQRIHISEQQFFDNNPLLHLAKDTKGYESPTTTDQ